MHYPSLMTTVSPSEGFVPFVQRWESSSWSQYYMYYVRKAMLSSSNYQLDQCFSKISGASYADKFADLAGPNEFTRLPSGVFWWLINIRLGYLVFGKVIHARSSLTCPTILLGSSVTINYTLATPTLAFVLAVTYLKVLGRGIIV